MLKCILGGLQEFCAMCSGPQKSKILKEEFTLSWMPFKSIGFQAFTQISHINSLHIFFLNTNRVCKAERRN